MLRLVMRMCGGPQASQRRLIAAIKASTDATLTIRFQKIEAKSLRELMSIDPKSVYAGIKCPALLIGGEKDVQCDPADVARIARIAQAPVESHVLANLTHLLRRDEGPASLHGSAKGLSKPMDSEVLNLIDAWLCRRVSQAIDSHR